MDDKDTKKGGETLEEIKRMRLTLKSREVKPLEHACAEIISRAKKNGPGHVTRGPVRIPTKILRITTRKSPCGEGTNTWDRYEMRIHKRVIDIFCPISVVRDITSFKMSVHVDIDLQIHNE
jgi:small subunit ribosomal protein S20e